MSTPHYERIVQWPDFSISEKHKIAASMLTHFKFSTKQTPDLVQIFDLTNPEIILGANDGGTYARLAETTPERKEVLKLLLHNYL
jgi:hypothetical protein